MSKTLSAILALLLFQLSSTADLRGSEGITSLQRHVPIFYDGITIRVPIQMFGRTLCFIVDSGSTISGVDVRYIHYLGEQIEDLQTSAMNAAGPRLAIYHCPDGTVADIPIHINSIAVMNLAVIGKISGSPCDGVLGMDFLRQNVIAIDLDKDIMTISNEISDETRSGELAIPLRSIRGQHVAVDATVNQVKTQLMIDTGDSGSMSLNSTDWNQVFATGQTKIHTILAGGASGDPMRISAARINSLKISSRYYGNLVATLVKNPAAPSTLGLKFLRRHIVTFDFANQTLYLRPSSLYAEIESADMSGLHIIRQGNETVIYAVDEQSPAAQAKLTAGDIIESINGTPASTLSLRNIRRALKSQDKESVTIDIKRGNEISVYQFALRSSL
jgi:hypothetical protein